MWCEYRLVDATAQRVSKGAQDQKCRSASGCCREVWSSCSLSSSNVSLDWIYEPKLMAFRIPSLPLAR
jgi:hypothetical protein